MKYTRCRRAFTLTELLVSVGVLMLGVALLLPTIDAAQRAARATRCASNLRLLLHGLHLYAHQSGGFLPGSPWTSSAHFRTAADLTDPALVPAGVTEPLAPDEVGTGWTGPVAPFDWATPILTALGELPSAHAGTSAPTSVRRDRTASLLAHRLLRCPENRLEALPLSDPTWPAVHAPSYFANADFLLRAPPPGRRESSGVGLYVSGPAARLPLYYRPRLRDVGPISTKAFFVEGTAPLRPPDADLAGGHVTYPTDPFQGQQWGGAFAAPRLYASRADAQDSPRRLLTGHNADPTLAPPERGTRTALGFPAGGHPSGEGLFTLAYARHGTRRTDAPLSAYRTNLAFLDGHVESLDLLTALTPAHHSPTGTTIDVRRQWVYPRVILQHFGGKEGSTVPIK